MKLLKQLPLTHSCFVSSDSSSVWDCNFEQGLCSYTQLTDDQFDWTRAHGKTATQGTGPSFDHTQGTGESKDMKEGGWRREGGGREDTKISTTVET